MLGTDVTLVPGPSLARVSNAQVKVRVGADKELFGDTLTQLDRSRKQIEELWMYTCDFGDSYNKAKGIITGNPFEITQRLRDAANRGSGAAEERESYKQVHTDDDGNEVGTTTFLVQKEKATLSLSALGAADDIYKGKTQASHLQHAKISLRKQKEIRLAKRQSRARDRMVEIGYMALAITPRDVLARLDLEQVLYGDEHGASTKKEPVPAGLSSLNHRRASLENTAVGTAADGRSSGVADLSMSPPHVGSHTHTGALWRTQEKLERERERRRDLEVQFSLLFAMIVYSALCISL
jgi:hypothetical protein